MESVWVVDQAAWTENVPIYSMVELSICNTCGADVTGNCAAHAKVHAMAGEPCGHHSEWVKQVTGYDSVTHQEVGHWEQRVTDGHWE